MHASVCMQAFHPSMNCKGKERNAMQAFHPGRNPSTGCFRVSEFGFPKGRKETQKETQTRIILSRVSASVTQRCW